MKKTFCNACFSLKRMRPVKSISLFLVGLVMAGCPAGKQTPESVSTGKIVIKGSNTIGEELAPHLVAEYKKEHPAANFDIEPKATMYGLAALRVGQCDIAAASREALKEELEMAHSLGIELKEYIIGAYSVAVIVNAGNSVKDLTRGQVRDIFTGVIQNWKEVGGPDAPVHLHIRDPISGTYLGFKELAMDNKPYAEHPKVLTSYAAIAQAVAQDPNGIGYCSIDLTKSSSVKAVSIGGADPSAASVNKGQYPFSRVLRFYTNKTKESSEARDFIQFVQSPGGQKIVEQTGFVPRM